MADTKTSTPKFTTDGVADALLLYSEWLDGDQGLLAGPEDEDGDDRTLTQLVQEFIDDYADLIGAVRANASWRWSPGQAHSGAGGRSTGS